MLLCRHSYGVSLVPSGRIQQATCPVGDQAPALDTQRCGVAVLQIDETFLIAGQRAAHGLFRVSDALTEADGAPAASIHSGVSSAHRPYLSP